jgi:hypothetical protein
MPGPTKSEILTYVSGLEDRANKKVLIGQQILAQRLQLRSSYEDYFLDLLDATGRIPAVFGCAYRRYDPVFTAADITLMNWLMIDHWNSGGISVIQYNANNPWTGGAATDLTRDQWALEDLVDSGEAIYTTWHNELDTLAGQLQDLADRDVVTIWRPFHECTLVATTWWNLTAAEWSADQSRAIASFTDMWEDMHAYLNTTHGLGDYLIWLYSTANRHTRDLSLLFPGSSYADWVGCTTYTDSCTINTTGYSELQSCGVPVSISEFGHDRNDAGAWSNMNSINSIKANYPDLFWLHYYTSWNATNLHAIVDCLDSDDLMTDTWIIPRGYVTPNTNVCGISFEQNDTTSFGEETDSADLSTSASGLDSTSYKLEVDVDATPSYGTRYVQIYADQTEQLHIELFFDPNLLTTGYNKTILRITNDAQTTDYVSIDIDRSVVGDYMVTCEHAGDSITYSQELGITDAEHSVELFLRRATGVAAANGRMEMSVDGGSATVVSTVIDNWDNWVLMTRLDMGDIAGDTSAQTIYLDQLFIDGDDWYTPTPENPYIRVAGYVRVAGRVRVGE